MKRALLAAFLLLAGCGRKEPLPDLGVVGPFSLTAESGRLLDSRELAGRIWVADFIFTNCTGPCPRMSTLMTKLQAATASFPAVRLISITVDPERDTPEVLAAYGRRYQQDPARWTLLTGDPKAIHALSRNAFKLGDVDASLTHSTRFVLVDPRGRIRSYYGTADQDPVEKVTADIRSLLEEPQS